MSALSKILRDTEDNGLVFWCPGCDGAHRIQHGEGSGPRWGWNGSVDKPTFTPSVLVSSSAFTDKGQADYDDWYAAVCPKNDDGSLHQFENAPTVCPSFVNDGRIQFLGDCTHHLAGQTVDLPEFKWGDQDD